MKKTSFLALVIAMLAVSCNFSAGVKKDFGTTLSFEYNGFGVEEVAFVGPDNERASNNEVKLNTQVSIVAQGLTNYQLKDEKAFPGLALTVKDEQGNAVIDEADLFAESEGFSPQVASIIRGSITIGSPMEPGKTYDVLMRLWDKNKPETQLTVTMEIVVTE